MADAPPHATLAALAAARKLKKAGLDDKQAEAIAETQVEAAHAVLSGFMTKAEFLRYMIAFTITILGSHLG